LIRNERELEFLFSEADWTSDHTVLAQKPSEMRILTDIEPTEEEIMQKRKETNEDIVKFEIHTPSKMN
jgi:hypothetical protein